MAELSNREIKQELDNLKKALVAGGGGASVEITTGVPIVSGRENNGDLAFDATNDNLYIFSQGVYEVTSEKLFERYALNVTNTNNEGKVSNTSDVEEFSVNPKDSSGNDLPWKGTVLSNAASEVSTDYVWVNIKGETGAEGSAGDDGVYDITVYQDDADQPSISGGVADLENRTLSTNPAGWVIPPTVGTTNQRWKSKTTIDPNSTSGTNVKEKATTTFNGVTGGTTVVDSKEKMTVSGASGITGAQTTNPAVAEALQAIFQGTSGTQTTTAAVAEVPRVGITGTTAGSDASGGSGTAETSAFTINTTSSSGTGNGGNAYFTVTLSDTNFFVDTTDSSISDYLSFRVNVEDTPASTFNAGAPPTGTYTAEQYVVELASSFNTNFTSGFTASSSGRVLTITKDDSSDVVLEFSDSLLGFSLSSSITNSVTLSGFDGDGTQIQTLTYSDEFLFLPDGTFSSSVGASVLSFTFDSTYSSSPVTTGNIPASSTTTAVAALGRTALNAAITAGTLTGYTVTPATNSVITLVATSTGNRTDITATYTGVTDGISETITDGTSGGGSATRDTYTMNAGSPHSPASLTSSFANDLPAADCITQARNHIINGDIGGYGNVTAIGANSYFEMTSDTAGVETDFALAITQGTGSDLVATNSVTTQGADAFTTGALDTCTLTARGVTKTFTIASGSISTSQYTQAYNYLTAVDPITGVTISGSGSTLGVTSTATGNETDYTLVVTSNGTAGSPTITRTQGTDETTTGTLDSWTAVIDGTTYTQSYTSGADATKQLSEPNTYLVAQGVDSSISGSAMTVNSATNGNKTNFTFVNTLTGTDQTAVLLTVSNTDGTTTGTTDTNTGTVTIDSVAYSVSFTKGEIAATQAATSSTYLNTQSAVTTVYTVSVVDGELVIEGKEFGNKADITYTIDTGKTGQTATNPSVSITQGSSTALTWTTPVKDGINGTDGLQGFNTATVSVYQRKSTAPTDAPNTVGTYTFSTANLLFPSDATVSNNWHTTIAGATGSEQLYVRSATVASRDTTDTIAINEWSGVVQAGSTGEDGDDGLSNASVVYYQRTASSTAPTALPSSEAAFNLGTGALTPATNGNWQTLSTISSTGKYLWFTTATATSRTATDTIATSEWASALLLSEDGDKGDKGDDGDNAAVNSEVYFSVAQSSAPSTPSATSYSLTSGTFVGLTANWSTSSQTLDASQSNSYWQSTFNVTASGTLTFATPQKVATFSNVLASGGIAAGQTLKVGTIVTSDTAITSGSGSLFEADGDAFIGTTTNNIIVDVSAGTLTVNGQIIGAGNVVIDGTTLVANGNTLEVGAISTSQVVETGDRVLDFSANGSSNSAINGVAGNGADYTLVVTGNITVDVNAHGGSNSGDSGTAGNGGDWTVTSTNGNIIVTNLDVSGGSNSGDNGVAGDGGTVVLTALNGCITGTTEVDIGGGSTSGIGGTTGSSGSLSTTSSAGNVCA